MVENAAMSPKLPIGLPLTRAPCDWLQS